MKLNKYLEELGYKWEDLPGNYNPDLDFGDAAAADSRNKEDEEGFCGYEFFNLDHSMALYIYPRLCIFRERMATIATPSCFCYDEDGNHKDDGNKEWLQTIDKMILAFKYILNRPEWKTKEERKEIDDVINEGLHIFAEYYCCLWY